MIENKLLRVDGLLWKEHGSSMFPYKAHCPEDRLELTGSNVSRQLKCPECKAQYNLDSTYSSKSNYVRNKVTALKLKELKVFSFDDEAMPLAESKDKDENYFVIAKIAKTKVGKRLVVYAGEKGTKDKTQIFIEPDIKRLAFDQKDQHPSEVFVKLEAQFKDGQKQSMQNE